MIMADGFIVLTNTAISTDEFVAFLPRLGAYATSYGDEQIGGFQGQMDEDGSSIWIAIDNGVHGVTEDFSAERPTIVQKLNAEPQTAIVIERLNYEVAATRLSLKFVQSFAQYWTCVVLMPGRTGENQDQVFSVDELLNFYSAYGIKI